MATAGGATEEGGLWGAGGGGVGIPFIGPGAGYVGGGGGTEGTFPFCEEGGVEILLGV